MGLRVFQKIFSKKLFNIMCEVVTAEQPNPVQVG
jgi:hypothetical protein